MLFHKCIKFFMLIHLIWDYKGCKKYLEYAHFHLWFFLLSIAIVGCVYLCGPNAFFLFPLLYYEIPLHSFKQTNAQRHFVAFQFYNTLQKSVYGTSLGYIHSMVDLLCRQKYGFVLKHVGRKREKSVMLQINSCIYSF